MKGTRAEMKAQLLGQAERKIGELLDWAESSSRPTLNDIEGAVLKIRKDLEPVLAQGVIEAQESTQPVPGPLCPSCGREMQVKGRKGRGIETRLGLVEMERDYTTAHTVSGGLFLLDEQLRLWDKGWSEGLAKLVVRLSG